MTTLAPLLPRKSFLALMRAFTLTAAILIPAFYAHAASYKILYRFQGGNDGWLPYGNLLSDGHGGFYGTTYNGGSTTLCRGNGCGTVFHLTPPTAADAAWAETVLYSFQGGESDGEGPNGNIVIDSDGSLYGATLGGGSANTGVIYKLSPPAQAGGAWSETILHAFTFGSPDGDAPTGGVVWAPSHALYGETNYGGIYRGDCEDTGCGTIYQVAPPAEASGSWSESVLYSFELPQCCGDYGTIVYRDGVLYGSSFYGGSTATAACLRWCLQG
ncbi:MAG: choice-of-anchor tandem repeat GloVer-containing protein [Candidatus Sulfotelmatobacter sp.]